MTRRERMEALQAAFLLVFGENVDTGCACGIYGNYHLDVASH